MADAGVEFDAPANVSPDAGLLIDAWLVDALPVDACRLDAAPVDAALIDAAPVDAALIDAPPSLDASVNCHPPGMVPTYSELYTRHFAVGTAGHCATENCHGSSVYYYWSCGSDSRSCYAGMLGRGLIDPANPPASMLASRDLSPIVWVNPSGPMPFDGTRPFLPGSSAAIACGEIVAWANAGALNN